MSANCRLWVKRHGRIVLCGEPATRRTLPRGTGTCDRCWRDYAAMFPAESQPMSEPLPADPSGGGAEAPR